MSDTQFARGHEPECAVLDMPVTILHGIRRLTQRFGLDVTRYPQSTLGYQANQLLPQHRVDVVLDVGANDGGYATMLRHSGYRGRVVSFEPLREPFRRLQMKSTDDQLWMAVPWAIGDAESMVDINVAGNAEASSSVLQMLPRHAEAAPDSQYVGIENVRQRRLDVVWPDLVPAGERVFLKVDVQGAEKNVLLGAGEMISRCVGVQMEVSFSPLYEGGMLYREAMDLLEGFGFSLMYVVPGFTDPRTGRMYQCDVVCFRE